MYCTGTVFVEWIHPSVIAANAEKAPYMLFVSTTYTEIVLFYCMMKNVTVSSFSTIYWFVILVWFHVYVVAKKMRGTFFTVWIKILSTSQRCLWSTIDEWWLGATVQASISYCWVNAMTLQRSIDVNCGPLLCRTSVGGCLFGRSPKVNRMSKFFVECRFYKKRRIHCDFGN